MTPRNQLAHYSVIALGICLLVTGCNQPPRAPKDANGDRIEILVVSPDQREELAAAVQAETARVNYRYRLDVLRGYYDQVGNMDKLIWARREIKNLDQAWTFSWGGLPSISPPAGESLAQADERALVEYVAAARKAYNNAVADLAGYYQATGRNFETRLIMNVQDRLDPVRTYMYYLAAELPPESAKPAAVIPEADALFAEGIELHKRGKGLLRFALTTSYPKQRAALLKFQRIVAEYPSSTKAAQRCYYIGEILKEYFNENVRAVHWYRRAWQLDANIDKPARFQAASVYDLRLQDKAKAVECYRMCIQHEPFNPSNVRYANQRIAELTGQ